MLRKDMILSGRYEILGRIGSGGMSEVFKARDMKLNRFVAIKVLKQEYSSDQNFVVKFRMEAQSAACLTNPNIVNIFDVGEDSGLYFIVMELIEGITLKQYIARRQKLEIREAIEVAIQVSKGLAAAHAEHIVHRDIKPQNIMITREGKIKVTDFGIARVTSSQTISSNTMGSVHYISPEQARGGHCDERSDIYSLGITMYEMLTGRVPFDGENTVAVALQHIQGEMVPPSRYEPLIPISLEKIVLKCTQKRPDQRYFSAEELIEDLRKALTMPNVDFVVIPAVNTGSVPSDAVNKARMEQTARLEQERLAEAKYQMGEEEENASEKEEETEADEDDSDGKFEKIVTYIGIGVGILILLILLAVGLRACGVLNFKDNQKETTEATTEMAEPVMINLMGMTYDEAYAALKDMGLYLKATYENSEDVAEGLIFRQSIENGTVVTRDMVVTVVISSGQKLLMIPAVSDKTPADARSSLSSCGFTNVSASNQQEFSETVEAGLVIRTDPVSGSSVPANATITLVVSAGPEIHKVQVPSLKNMTEEDARALLQSYQLNVGTVDQAYSDSVPAGKVISQTPIEGTEAREEDAVSFVISLGSEYVEVPNLKGDTLSEAKEELTAMGLKLGTDEYEHSDAVYDGKVIGQSETAGTRVRKGTTVNIVIGTGPEVTEADAETDAPVEPTSEEEYTDAETDEDPNAGE